MGFDVKCERIQGILIAIILGRIDGANAEEFQRVMDAAVEPGDNALLMDFERVAYISSAGLRVALSLARQFNGPGKQFGICSLNDSVREVFTISGFDKIVSISESREAAIGEFTNN